MRRALLLVLAATLVLPSASAGIGIASEDVETLAAGPGTGLRYAERFQADDRWQETTLIVTVDDRATARDAHGVVQEATPVTVQRRAEGEVLAAERCWADAEEPSSVRREPIAGPSLDDPLQRAWKLAGGSPNSAFQRVPSPWPTENTSALFDARPCPARGPGATMELAGPGTPAIERLLPAGLPTPEGAELDGDVHVEEAGFHERPASWVNATFHLRLPGPLPGADTSLQPGPLVVDGRSSSLWAQGLPGPAQRAVELSLEAPHASGYDEELAWEIELTGHEPGESTDLAPSSERHAETSTTPWTAEGPATRDYEVSFPLEEAIAALEEQGARYRAFQLQHPDAFVRSATYEDAASPPPLDQGPRPVSIRGPAWTVELADPSGEAYRGGVLETSSSDPTPERAEELAPAEANRSSTTQPWESPTEAPAWHGNHGPALDDVGPIASGAEIRDRLQALGFPTQPLDRLAFEVHVPQASDGPRVSIELAASVASPPGAHTESVRAIADGDTGRVIAISETMPEDGEAGLSVPVPPTFDDQETGSSSGGTLALPDGPSAGVGLAAGAGILWLLVLGLKALLSPLFTRISRDELLENPTRRQLLETIREDPGVHLARLIEETGVGNGATRHHLAKLEDANFVQVVKHGGYMRFFPAGEFTEAQARQQATLRSGSNQQVYEAYREDPGRSVRELAERVGKSSSSVHRALRMLREVDLIEG